MTKKQLIFKGLVKTGLRTHRADSGHAERRQSEAARGAPSSGHPGSVASPAHRKIKKFYREKHLLLEFNYFLPNLVAIVIVVLLI